MIITTIELTKTTGAMKKFLLLEDGRLIFGMCMYHKDLVIAFFGDDSDNATMLIIGAGIIPDDITIDIEDAAWGGWRSTGYDITTPSDLREAIRDALKTVIV